MVKLDWSRTCAQWVRELGQMDPVAWQRLFDRRRPGIVAIAANQGLSHADADDVASEVIVSLLKNMQEGRFEYDDSRSFNGLLVTMTRNKTADFLRRNARSPRQIAEGHDTEDRIRNGWDNDDERLWRLVEAWLKEQADSGNRDVEIWQMTQEGRSVAEVAAHFGLSSSGAVYTARYRVKKGLEDILAKE